MDDDNPQSEGTSQDPLERMSAHRYARELVKLAWEDGLLLQANPLTPGIAEQFYESVGSIAANLGEGYSKSSGPDRARSFEYALGSARETVEWYESGRPVLTDERVNGRLEILGHIIRLLVAVIPRERNRTIKPGRRKRRPKRKR